MQPHVIDRLRDLNRGFYQSFGDSFAATRVRVQPGVAQVMAETPPDASVLDLGCGHGHLAEHLVQHGHHGSYLGIDSSETLIKIARSTSRHPHARFKLGDLQQPAWAQDIPADFTHITAFAVLHHIAGSEPRLALLKAVREHIQAEGVFIFSCWNFLASEKLRKRVQPWSVVGLSEQDVDPGDYLLDWRAGGLGYRYVHHYTEEELQQLAAAAGFRMIDNLYADGASGNLGLYQQWQPMPSG